MLKNNLITLSRGKFAIVDDSNYEYLNQWKWSYSDTGYAYRHQYRKGKKPIVIKMHRLIMNTPLGMETDHINGERLDNRRSNLRICTKAQNMQNQKPIRGKTSKYKGVCWDKSRNKWMAKIKMNKKNKNLGRFYSEIEAALAYNKAALQLFEQFARINIL